MHILRKIHEEMKGSVRKIRYLLTRLNKSGIESFVRLGNHSLKKLWIYLYAKASWNSLKTRLKS